MMKVLVVGCGSIGRRHAANAAALAETAVMDINGARTAELDIEAFDDLEKALAWGPDGVVVATPHSSHLEVAWAAVDAGADVLIEKPLSQDMTGVEDFLNRTEALGRKTYVVTNMRFHPGVATLGEHLAEIGIPLLAKAHFGSFLPDMRPGVDYRKLDCVHPGFGGVVLDSIHEFDYLIRLFGAVEEVEATTDRLGSLGIDCEDYAGVVLRHASGVCSEIHLNWLQRPKRRGCEVVGSGGTLIWNSNGKNPERCEVRLYPAQGQDSRVLWESHAVDHNRPFVVLMEHFLAALSGGDTPLSSGRAGARVLEAALAACRSAETGRAAVLSGAPS
jgi:predicted dehydrogenase